MSARMKVLSWLAGLSLALGLWVPTAAGSGAGTTTCDGDGTLVLAGDFVSLSVATDAGALVHTRPTHGQIVVSTGTGFVKYFTNGVTLYVGSGSGTAINVANTKLTLSGAAAHLAATGRGRLVARGTGTCTNGKGVVYTWKPYDTTMDVGA